MNIKLQITTLLFSFLYGIFFSFFLSLNYKFIYSDKKDLDYNFEKYKKRVYRAHKKAFEHLEEKRNES